MPVVGGTSVVVGVLGGARGAGVLVARAAGWLVSTHPWYHCLAMVQCGCARS